MKFKSRNLRELAEMIIGDAEFFQYRSSSYITRFFEECELDFVHDGSTRWSWTSSRLEQLLQEPQPGPNLLPDSFVRVFRVLMDRSDAADDDPDRSKALGKLNKTLQREGYEAFYGDDGLLYFKHLGTQSISVAPNPHRPFTTAELKKREHLSDYLDKCTEDELIEDMAVSRIKRNTFSELGHLLGHHLFRGQPPQRLTGSAVEQPGDVVEVGLAHLRQVGALRQELA